MQTVTTVGLDIAKSVFQVHCIDAADQVVIRRQLKRRYVLAFFRKLPPCLIGIEACASSHYWSRELQALGHKVRLMPAAYVTLIPGHSDQDETFGLDRARAQAALEWGQGQARQYQQTR
jgi:transposase